MLLALLLWSVWVLLKRRSGQRLVQTNRVSPPELLGGLCKYRFPPRFSRFVQAVYKVTLRMLSHKKVVFFFLTILTFWLKFLMIFGVLKAPFLFVLKFG